MNRVELITQTLIERGFKINAAKATAKEIDKNLTNYDKVISVVRNRIAK